MLENSPYGNPLVRLRCYDGTFASSMARATGFSSIPARRCRATLVRGPAIIGGRSEFVDAYVGPYTSIGADVRVENTETSIPSSSAPPSFVRRQSLETSIIGLAARASYGV